MYLNILYVIFEIYASLERFYTNQLTLLATFKTLNAISIDSDRSDNILARITKLRVTIFTATEATVTVLTVCPLGLEFAL